MVMTEMEMMMISVSQAMRRREREAEKKGRRERERADQKMRERCVEGVIHSRTHKQPARPTTTDEHITINIAARIHRN